MSPPLESIIYLFMYSFISYRRPVEGRQLNVIYIGRPARCPPQRYITHLFTSCHWPGGAEQGWQLRVHAAKKLLSCNGAQRGESRTLPQAGFCTFLYIFHVTNLRHGAWLTAFCIQYGKAVRLLQRWMQQARTLPHARLYNFMNIFCPWTSNMEQGWQLSVCLVRKRSSTVIMRCGDYRTSSHAGFHYIFTYSLSQTRGVEEGWHLSLHTTENLPGFSDGVLGEARPSPPMLVYIIHSLI